MRTVGMGAEKKLDALEKLKAEKEALLKENGHKQNSSY